MVVFYRLRCFSINSRQIFKSFVCKFVGWINQNWTITRSCASLYSLGSRRLAVSFTIWILRQVHKHKIQPIFFATNVTVDSCMWSRFDKLHACPTHIKWPVFREAVSCLHPFYFSSSSPFSALINIYNYVQTHKKQTCKKQFPLEKLCDISNSQTVRKNTQQKCGGKRVEKTALKVLRNIVDGWGKLEKKNTSWIIPKIVACKKLLATNIPRF